MRLRDKWKLAGKDAGKAFSNFGSRPTQRR